MFTVLHTGHVPGIGGYSVFVQGVVIYRGTFLDCKSYAAQANQLHDARRNSEPSALRRAFA